jgi:acyl-CoA oxidase
MLYVAWADGELTDSEISSICTQLSAVEGLDQSCQSALGRWLDPNNPPSSTDLVSLLAQIRRSASSLSNEERRSLTDLGVEIARLEGVDVSFSVLQALNDLEVTLGLEGGEAVRQLLAPMRPYEPPIEPEHRFDIESMTALLDGDQMQIRRQVRNLISQPGFEYLYGLGSSEYRQVVLQRVKSLADSGIGALSYPVEFGGSGDMAAFIAAFETAAFGDLSVLIKFGVQFGLFGGSILQLGTEHHHESYLPRVGSLELPGCFAMTETDHGSNVYDLETVAKYDPATREFVITTPHDGARKDYIGNAALHGRLATVFAQLEVGGQNHGVHALLVPVRDDEGKPCRGVRIEDCGEKLGLDGVDNGRLWFQNVRVPRSNLLDRFGSVSEDGVYDSPIASPARRFFTMLGTLVGGRVSVALGALSASKSALTIATRYSARRRQFGPAGGAEVALLDYRTHQKRLMPRVATSYALDFALKHLVERYVQSTEEDRREVEALAAGLKAYSTRHATDSIQECREACGGQGYLAENRIAALKADTDVFTTFEGDNTVLLQLVSKSLLTGFRRQFGEMGVLGLARYIAAQAATAVAELNPVVTRRTEEEHLRSREFQTGALRWREEHLLISLARRIKKRLDEGLDSFEALNQVQDHAIALAQAHVESVVLEQFVAGIERCDDTSLCEALDLICDVYALDRIDDGRGWFQAHGYLEAPKAKAIRKMVNRLCAEMRLQALPLVDSFGIPDALLAAPIAL